MSVTERQAVEEARSLHRSMHEDGAPAYENELVIVGQGAIAGEIAGIVPLGSRVLDWGGGRGWLSYLLDKMGFKVTYYEFPGEEEAEPLKSSMPEVERVFIEVEDKLPFDDGSFDAVVSCGVLEHVSDPRAACKELKRILRPGGHMFVYHFPNRYSYTEFLARRLGTESHDLLMDKKAFAAMLSESGLEVKRTYYKYLLPRNLPHWPRLRNFASRRANGVFAFDKFLVRIPLLNRISTSLNAVAVKRR